MSAYAVEHYLPDADALQAIVSRLVSAAEAISADGLPARLACSILVCEDELCIHVFAAASQEAVAKTAERAGLPIERIAEAALVWPAAR